MSNKSSHNKEIKFDPYDYQKRAIKAVFHEWEEGRRRTLLTMATGTGKTVIFAHITRKVVSSGGRMLILAHRTDLIDQAENKIKVICEGYSYSIEKGPSRAYDSKAPIILGTVQSFAYMNRKTKILERLAEYSHDAFTHIIVDEAHHCTADQFLRVLGFFPNAKVLGVTATPDRNDERTLSSYFESIAFDYPLKKAIEDKRLCPISANLIPIKMDLRNVSTINGDYAPGELSETIEPYLETIADKMKTYCKGRKTAVFLPLIKTVKLFEGILKKKGFKAIGVDGTFKSSDRQRIYKAFEKGIFDVILCSLLLTEGWDCPSTDCIICLRPTQSRPLYQQIIGRGTRLSPETGKKELLLLDFLWQTKRFKELASPANLISTDPDVVAIVQNKLAQGFLLDLSNADKNAKKELIRKAQLEEEEKEKAREAALRKQLQMQRDKEAELQVNPMQFAIALESMELLHFEPVFNWQKEKPTDAQLNFLVTLGIDARFVDSKGLAAELISILVEREKQNMATPKQIRLLKSKGYEDVSTWTREQAYKEISELMRPSEKVIKILTEKGFKYVSEWNKTEAASIINIISKNNWAVPENLDVNTCMPERIRNKYFRTEKLPEEIFN